MRSSDGGGVGDPGPGDPRTRSPAGRITLVTGTVGVRGAVAATAAQSLVATADHPGSTHGRGEGER